MWGFPPSHTGVRLCTGAEELGGAGDVGAGAAVKAGGRGARQEAHLAPRPREGRRAGAREGVRGRGEAGGTIQTRGGVTRRHGTVTPHT